MGYMVCSGMEDGQEINPVYNPGRTGNEEYPNTSEIWDLERGMQYPQMSIWCILKITKSEESFVNCGATFFFWEILSHQPIIITRMVIPDFLDRHGRQNRGIAFDEATLSVLAAWWSAMVLAAGDLQLCHVRCTLE